MLSLKQKKKINQIKSKRKQETCYCHVKLCTLLAALHFTIIGRSAIK